MCFACRVHRVARVGLKKKRKLENRGDDRNAGFPFGGCWMIHVWWSNRVQCCFGGRAVGHITHGDILVWEETPSSEEGRVKCLAALKQIEAGVEKQCGLQNKEAAVPGRGSAWRVCVSGRPKEKPRKSSLVSEAEGEAPPTQSRLVLYVAWYLLWAPWGIMRCSEEL